MTKAEAIKVLSESIHDGSKVPWDKIVEAVHLSIEALSQPSLPSNLDEAAEEFCDNEFNEGSCTCIGMAVAFKAGAEWMAGQGVAYEDIVESDDENDYLFMESIGSMISLEDTFKSGDKVVVQIRKK